MEHDAIEYVISGYFYIIYTPEPNKLNRSGCGIGTDFEEDIFEVIGIICYIASSGCCLIVSEGALNI